MRPQNAPESSACAWVCGVFVPCQCLFAVESNLRCLWLCLVKRKKRLHWRSTVIWVNVMIMAAFNIWEQGNYTKSKLYISTTLSSFYNSYFNVPNLKVELSLLSADSCVAANSNAPPRELHFDVEPAAVETGAAQKGRGRREEGEERGFVLCLFSLEMRARTGNRGRGGSPSHSWQLLNSSEIDHAKSVPFGCIYLAVELEKER